MDRSIDQSINQSVLKAGDVRKIFHMDVRNVLWNEDLGFTIGSR